MRQLVILFLLIKGIFTYGQGPANNWFFGNRAGLTFDTTPPSALTNGALSTPEGCASISDEDGNLLFYTDGITVYDRTHNIMPNGTELKGDPSSSQSALIIPKPLDPDLYYVFTIDTRVSEETPFQGLNYSIIDFTSNVNGEVTSKNIQLLEHSSEKLSAVIQGCTSDAVWMVTLSTASGSSSDPFENINNNFNTFFAFKIDGSGTIGTPVKSTFPININDHRGIMKFSPDGKRIACANGTSGLFLFDFDAQTGIVSNEQQLRIEGSDRSAYGVEFSPNNRFLYLNTFNGNFDKNPHSTIIQYDLQNPNINDSQYIVTSDTYFRGGLQLGPDGKIYRAISRDYSVGLPFLSTINNPNGLGNTCNYQDQSINLGRGLSLQGLPPFNQSLFNQVDIIQNNVSTSQLNLCEDETYRLRYEQVSGGTYTWFQDGNQINNPNTYFLDITLPPNVSLPYSVTYEMRLDRNDGTCERIGRAIVTYYKNPEAISNAELVQCNSNSSTTAFNLTESYELITQGNSLLDVSFYENQNDATLGNNALDPNNYSISNNNKTIFYTLTNSAGCNTIAPMTLTVSNTQANDATLYTCDLTNDGLQIFDLDQALPQITPPQPTPTYDITYYLSYEDALLENKLGTLPNIYVIENPYNQVVYARLENNNKCFDISEINLIVDKLPEFKFVEETKIYCTNSYPETVTLAADLSKLNPTRTYTYTWMPGDKTTPQIQVNEVGIYELTITDVATGCSNAQTIEVIEKSKAQIESIEVTDASENNIAIIHTNGIGEYEYALSSYGPFQDENIFENLSPGFYTVFVRSKDNCGSTQQDFSILGFKKYFTPNGDGINDYWNIKGATNNIQPGSRIRIYDRYGKLIKQLDPLSTGWDGTYNGAQLPAGDYWFHAVLKDGRVFKSHFSLIRR